MPKLTVCVTGIPLSGKTLVALTLKHTLEELGYKVVEFQDDSAEGALHAKEDMLASANWGWPLQKDPPTVRIVTEPAPIRRSSQ